MFRRWLVLGSARTTPQSPFLQRSFFGEVLGLCLYAGLISLSNPDFGSDVSAADKKQRLGEEIREVS